MFFVHLFPQIHCISLTFKQERCNQAVESGGAEVIIDNHSGKLVIKSRLHRLDLSGIWEDFLTSQDSPFWHNMSSRASTAFPNSLDWSSPRSSTHLRSS